MDSKSPRRYQDHHHQLFLHHHHHHRVNLLPSPRHSLSSSNSSSSSSSNNNGLHHTQLLPPLSPKPISRSESANPYPTTFVQADTTSFKQVVQMLTGSTETAKQASASASAPKPNLEPTKPHHIPPIKKQSGFKLYERRNSLKNLHLNPLLPLSVFPDITSGFSPRKPEVLSPSILDFPALILSPVTPLIPDPFNRSRSTENAAVLSPSLDTEAEDKAIKDKGFFFHPSPASTPREAEPRLLPLFPTASPGSSSSS